MTLGITGLYGGLKRALACYEHSLACDDGGFVIDPTLGGFMNKPESDLNAC